MTLYLGLRAKPGTFHYPVIRTEKLPCSLPDHWENFTHIIVTSQSTVEYWQGPWDKHFLSIGKPTASCILRHAPHAKVSIAKQPTQEGLMELIDDFPQGSFFLPHSKKARPDLICYLKRKEIPFLAKPLYDTFYQMPLPIPNLSFFQEIVFTSPSTIEGFLRIYKTFPQNKKLTCIGPITQHALHLELNRKRV